MKKTKAKADSSRALVLVILVLASLAVGGKARDQYLQPDRRGPQFSTTSEEVLLSLRVPIVKQVQLALRQRGLYRGEIDGFMGENTQIAIQTFYVDHCYPAAPVITRWLLAQLGSEGKSVLGNRPLQIRQNPAID